MATGIPVAAGELVDLTFLNAVARAHWRKTTSKTVSNTVTETDLFNAEFTIDASAMGSTRILRGTVFLDVLMNASGNLRFRLKLGATTIFDSGASFAPANSATRNWLAIDFAIMNTGATNAQVAKIAILTPSTLPGSTFTTPATYGISNSSTQAFLAGYALNTAAVDTTVANALVLTVQHSTASVNQECKLYGASVEVV